jgi:hypothetical protein
MIQENTLKCSKLVLFLANKNQAYTKISGVIMLLCNHKDVLFHFWAIFLYSEMKKLFCCPALELFSCLPLWKTVRLHGKKIQIAANIFFV